MMGRNNLYLQIEGTYFDSEKKRFCVRINGEDVFFGGMGDRPKFLNIEEYDEGVSSLLCLVGDMKPDDKMMAFGYADLNAILKYNTISKIREKYNAFVNRPRIGDEVKVVGEDRIFGIVIALKKLNDIDGACVLRNNFDWACWSDIARLEKTGRRFETLTAEEIGEYMGVVNMGVANASAET